MKVRITIDFDEQDRAAVALHFGKDGLADRELLTTWADGTISSTLDEINAEYENSLDEDDELEDDPLDDDEEDDE